MSRPKWIAAVVLVAAVAMAALVVARGRREAPTPAASGPAKTIEQLHAELESPEAAVRRRAAEELGRRLGSDVPAPESTP